MIFKFLLTIFICLLNLLLFCQEPAIAKACYETDLRLLEPTEGIVSEAKVLVNLESKLMAIPKEIVLQWLKRPFSSLELGSTQDAVKDISLINFDSQAFIVSFYEVDNSLRQILKSNINPNCKIKDIKLPNPITKKENTAILEILRTELNIDQDISGQDMDIAKRYLFLANSYFEFKNYADAILEYENAIKYWPNFFEAWKGLAKCYQKLGRYDEQKRVLEKCLKINPLEKEIYIMYSSELIRSQDFQALRNLLLKAFFIYSNDPKILYHTALAFYLSGDNKGAERFYKRLLPLDKEKAKNLYDLLH